MELTPEQIGKINAILTDVEDGDLHRAIVIRHGLPDLQSLSSFLSMMRSLGVNIRGRHGRHGLSKKDREDFIEFLRVKKQAAQ